MPYLALSTNAEIEEAANAVMGFVWKDLSKGDAGGIVDGNMDILVASAPGLIAAVPGDAVAGLYDASQFLDVHVEELARVLALIAYDGLGWLQGREPGEAVTGQQSGYGGLGEAALTGDLEARHAQLSEFQDDSDLGIGGLTGTEGRPGAAIPKTLNTLAAIEPNPLGSRALAYMEGGRGLLPLRGFPDMPVAGWTYRLQIQEGLERCREKPTEKGNQCASTLQLLFPFHPHLLAGTLPLMKSHTLQIRVGILFAVLVLFATGYKAFAARVSAPVIVLTLPTPTPSAVVSQ